MCPAHIGPRRSRTNEVGPLCHIILSTNYEVPSTIKICGQGINDIIFMDAQALLERIILLKPDLAQFTVRICPHYLQYKRNAMISIHLVCRVTSNNFQIP